MASDNTRAMGIDQAVTFAQAFGALAAANAVNDCYTAMLASGMSPDDAAAAIAGVDGTSVMLGHWTDASIRAEALPYCWRQKDAGGFWR